MTTMLIEKGQAWGKEESIVEGYLERMSCQSLPCDLCGRQDAFLDTQSFICLCSACLKAFEAKPVHIKNSIERFLVGNVC